MKEFIKSIGIVITMLYFGLTAFASDFELNGINYTISSLTDLTVVVDGADDIEVQSLEIPETVEYKGKTLTVVSIKSQAFKGFTKLIEVLLPSSLSSIGDEVFQGDSCLNNVKLPENLGHLGKSVFRGCKALKEIKFPKGANIIPPYTFYECSSLDNILLPDSLDKIEEYAFYKCSSLDNFISLEGIQYIGNYAFCGTSIEEVEIPNSLMGLGEYVFSDTKIKTITFPRTMSIVGIPKGCFMDCSELETVLFEEGVSLNSIEEDAFRRCSKLTSIELPKSIELIGESAFRGCSALEEFEIPENVREIAPTIFWGCTDMSRLIIGEGLSGLPYNCTWQKSTDTSYNVNRLSLGSDYGFVESKNGEIIPKRIYTYLNSIKQIVIKDSDIGFSIKGFNDSTNNLIPAFGNIDLDYFYVGRPLQDIEEWKYDGLNSFFGEWSTLYAKIKYPQGTGNIKTLEISGFCTENPYFYQKIDTLILGKNIARFIPANLYKDNLKSITCFSTVPPTITDDTAIPTYVYTDVTLYVPYGCKEVYSEDLGWKNFWNIVEMDPSAGVDSINYGNENKESDEVDVYSVDGCLIEHKIQFSKIKNLPKGLYIIVSEGGSRKINI